MKVLYVWRPDSFSLISAFKIQVEPKEYLAQIWFPREPSDAGSKLAQPKYYSLLFWTNFTRNLTCIIHVSRCMGLKVAWKNGNPHIAVFLYQRLLSSHPRSTSLTRWPYQFLTLVYYRHPQGWSQSPIAKYKKKKNILYVRFLWVERMFVRI